MKLIIRNEKGVTYGALKEIYITLNNAFGGREDCFYTIKEVEDFENRDFILLEEIKNG